MNITIGILGGYGNNATIYFQELLAKAINNKSVTRRYYKTIVINDSELYDFEKIDTLKETSISQLSINKKHEKYIQILKQLNISILVSPCNTYSNLLPTDILGIKVLNIVEVTSNYVNNLKIKEVGLLCTNKTYKNRLYHEQINIDVIVIEECLDLLNIIIRLTMFGYYDQNQINN